MTTSKENETKKPLKLNRPGRLELKKTVETGQVKQSFSHGRSKSVMVEVKRKRTFERGSSGRMAEVTHAPEEVAEIPVEAEEVSAPPEAVIDKSNLSAQERASRMRALEAAKEEEAHRKVREAEEEQRRQEEAERQAQEEARHAAEEAARKQLEAEEAERESKRKKEDAAAALPAEASAPEVVVAPPAEKTAEREEARHGKPKGRDGGAPKLAPVRRGGEPRRRSGKLTISQALEGQDGRQRSLASVKRRREKQLRAMKGQQPHQPPQKVIREVVVPENHHRAGTGQPHGRARRRRGQVTHENGRHGDKQSNYRRRHRRTGGR